jgi:hypothetical protein
MNDPLTKLRESRDMARQCKRWALPDSRRSFISYALFWRRIVRVERLYCRVSK